MMLVDVVQLNKGGLLQKFIFKQNIINRMYCSPQRFNINVHEMRDPLMG